MDRRERAVVAVSWVERSTDRSCREGGVMPPGTTAVAPTEASERRTWRAGAILERGILPSTMSGELTMSTPQVAPVFGGTRPLVSGLGLAGVRDELSRGGNRPAPNRGLPDSATARGCDTTSSCVGTPLRKWASRLHDSSFPILKMLRFSRVRLGNPPRVSRISRPFSLEDYLAVKGGALIHGPNLVAWLVGSEWRNHCLLHEVVHQ